MRIIHLTLGLPPYRGGGLTKYATDLMIRQATRLDGSVTLVYPGEVNFSYPKKKIVRKSNFYNVEVYEIKNPVIIPLLHGVRNPLSLISSKNPLSNQELIDFYNVVKPDILHIHTLMGIPIEFVEFMKSKGVKIVYTTHDYYGLCLKANFINQDSKVCNTPGGSNCAICNQNAPGIFFLRLRNSRYLLKYKEQLSGKSIPRNENKNEPGKKRSITKRQIDSYDHLLQYYKNIFNLVDCFHFNSTVSKGTYEMYLTIKKFAVLPITHANIKDFRKGKQFNKEHIRLGFIGNTSIYKGYPMLKDVLLELKRNKIDNWSLQVWGGVVGIDSECDSIIYKGKYASNNLESVFNEMDLLIVPSIWKETFSLITLEALSYGVPVLVSSNVGAKDIVKKYNENFVIDSSFEALNSILQTILSNTSVLVAYNDRIVLDEFEYSFDSHIEKMEQLYISLLS